MRHQSKSIKTLLPHTSTKPLHWTQTIPPYEKKPKNLKT
jgi:hypothetical protein